MLATPPDVDRLDPELGELDLVFDDALNPSIGDGTGGFADARDEGEEVDGVCPC